MEIIVTSDTHNDHGLLKLPAKMDLFIHCGDFTYNSTLEEIKGFFSWIDSLDATYKVIIAGNHDKMFALDKAQALKHKPRSVVYLENSGVRLPNGLTIYGVPVVPRHKPHAFTLLPEQTKPFFERIPHGTDILVTHAPPKGILDKSKAGESCGSEYLLNRVKEVTPKMHLFGHIHESYGTMESEGIRFVNAAFLHKREVTGNEFFTISI